MTRLSALVLTSALAVTALIAPFAASASAQGDAALEPESEYCFVSGPLYVGGSQVYPGGRYCIPWPL